MILLKKFEFIDDEVSDTMDGYAGAMGTAVDKFKAWIE